MRALILIALVLLPFSAAAVAGVVAVIVAGWSLKGCLATPEVNPDATYEDHFDGERFYNVPDQAHAGITPH